MGDRRRRTQTCFVGLGLAATPTELQASQRLGPALCLVGGRARVRPHGCLPKPSSLNHNLLPHPSPPAAGWLQTTEGLIQAFGREQLLGVQEEVQLREQDFGNFQVRGSL